MRKSPLTLKKLCEPTKVSLIMRMSERKTQGSNERQIIAQVWVFGRNVKIKLLPMNIVCHLKERMSVQRPINMKKL